MEEPLASSLQFGPQQYIHPYSLSFLRYKQDHVVIPAMLSLQIFIWTKETILSLDRKLYTPATKGMKIFSINLYCCFFYVFVLCKYCTVSL